MNSCENRKESIEELEQRVLKYKAKAKDPQFVEYLDYMLKRIHEQKQQIELLKADLDRCHQIYVNRMAAAEAKMTEAKMAEAKAEEPKPEAFEVKTGTVYQDELLEVPRPNRETTPAKKSDTEFVIGTVLLSVVGGAFILTALVMLGMHFMNGFLKGMCLYAVSLAILLISEMVLYKKWPKLGMTFTAISLGGLYLSTVLNYLTFGNFNLWVALVVAVLITIMVILLGWKRDSVLYRAMGLITFYLSFFAIRGENTLIEFIVLIIITLLIQIMCIVVPIQSYKTAFRILHMYVNGIFTYIISLRFFSYEDMDTARVIFAICAMIIMQLLFVMQIRYQRAQEAAGRVVGKIGITVSYFIAGLFIYHSLPHSAVRAISGTEVLRFGNFAAMLALSVIAVLALRKGKEMWYPYFLINYIAFNLFCLQGVEWHCVIGMAVLVIVAKLLSLLKEPILRYSEAILTVIACIMCLTFNNGDWPAQAAVALVPILISVLFIRYWQTFYELILTFTIAFYTVSNVPSMLKLPVFVGIMFVGILAYNNVKQWKGKNVLLFNGIALGSQVICFLMLMNPVYRNAYLVYLCMLVFGLATIVLCFQEKYQMDFKCKNLILAIFLTYMALVVRTNLPVINSILMMLIALICVGLGFAVKEKETRIYGLVLSLLVCAKIVLYDFFSAEILQKTVLFFIVGALALAISGIYIILERKMNTQQISTGEEQ